MKCYIQEENVTHCEKCHKRLVSPGLLERNVTGEVNLTLLVEN